MSIVETQEVEERRVQVADGGRLVHGAQAGSVGPAGGGAAFHVAARPSTSIARSGQDRLHHLAVDIGQTKIASAETIGEFLVIDPEQMLHGRPQIVHRADILHRMVAEFIGGAVGRAALDAAAGQPDAESKRIVIATIR